MKTRLVDLTLSALLFGLCVSVQAQQPKRVPRIGVFEAPWPAEQFEAFLGELHKLGYIEGQNILLVHLPARGKPDRLRELAAELVRRKPDVMLTAGTQATRALKKATTAIPIVVGAAGDLVRRGVVASLARPGGNVTGLTSIAPDSSGKRLELLKEVLPEASRVAFLHRRGEQDELKATQTAAESLGIKIQRVEVEESTQFQSAYAGMVKERADAILIASNPLTNEHRRQLSELAIKSRLPAVCDGRVFADDGCLMSYSVDRIEMFRRAAHYVDKILKGRKPADLPIEQPTKFELVINLKTAKQIGVTIPREVLFRANKVIK